MNFKHSLARFTVEIRLQGYTKGNVQIMFAVTTSIIAVISKCPKQISSSMIRRILNHSFIDITNHTPEKGLAKSSIPPHSAQTSGHSSIIPTNNKLHAPLTPHGENSNLSHNITPPTPPFLLSSPSLQVHYIINRFCRCHATKESNRRCQE